MLRPVKALALVVVLLALAYMLLSPRGGGFDAEGVVVRVIDGDTIVVEVERSHVEGVHGAVKVRLADINAPELGTHEGEAAKGALKGLLEGSRVYLDVDDLYVRDRYGRVVAVVYIPYNETHLLNVNAWLLAKGLAEEWDHPNEFSPEGWALFVKRP